MATAQGIRAGRAYVELFADDSRLIRGMARAEKSVRQFGKSVAGVGQAIGDFGTKLLAGGAGLAAPLIAAARTFATVGDELEKMARRTGVSVEALSELGAVAELEGASLADLETGLRNMQKNAVAGAAAFDLLGINTGAFLQLSPEEQLNAVADALARIPDAATRTAAAIGVLGRSGTQLIPMLSGGAAGIAAGRGDARGRGRTVSTESARAAAHLGDTYQALWGDVKRTTYAIGEALAPALEQVAQWLGRVAVWARQWADQNKGLFPTLLAVAGGVVATGAALIALGVAFKAVGGAITFFASMMGGVIFVLKAVGVALAFLTTPVGLVVAAVVGLGALIAYYSGYAGKALDWLKGVFGRLKDEAVATYQGIADALAAGDIALAARVLWLALRMEWLKGVLWIKGLWEDFKNFFIRTAFDAFYGLEATWEIVGNALMTAWIELEAFAAGVWVRLTSAFTSAWDSAIGWTEKRIHELWGLLDKDYDANAAKKMVDERVAGELQAIENRKQDQLGAIEAERGQKQADAAQIYEGRMAAIGQKSIDKHAQLDAEKAASLAGAQADYDKAYADWKAAIEEARKKREGMGTPGAAGPLALPAIPPATELAGVSRGPAARGTFSPEEAARIAAGSRVEDILREQVKETKTTNRTLQDILNRGGLTFEP